ncbi:MAG: hypothetical protein IJA87_08440 [Clostridia bacterium]|nr:hypothetical protein [Clostridia bacterium]
MYDRVSAFLSKGRRRNNLYIATVVLFAFLAAEKAFFGLGIGLTMSGLTLSHQPDISDVLSLLVYTTVTLLVIAKVKYKYILIPDSLLFCLKLNVLISSIISLTELAKLGLLTELSVIEHLVEAFFFALFLAILFTGKLVPETSRFKHICPFLCLGTLAVCLPATIAFEAVKVFVEETVYNFSISIEVMWFVNGVLQEMVLDLPYALLVLLMFFSEKKQSKE